MSTKSHMTIHVTAPQYAKTSIVTVL